jgi:hypothetical protein
MIIYYLVEGRTKMQKNSQGFYRKSAPICPTNADTIQATQVV